MFEYETMRLLCQNYSQELRVLPEMKDERAMNVHFLAKGGSMPSEPTGSVNPQIMIWRTSETPLRGDPRGPPDTKLIGGSAGVLGALVVSNKFLRGSPWTHHNFQMFKLLSSAMGVAKLETAFYPDAEGEIQLFNGMEDAIREGDVELLKALLQANGRLGSES